MKKNKWLLAPLVGFALSLSGCGNDTEPTATPTPAPAPGNVATPAPEEVNNERDWDPNSHLDLTWMTIFHSPNPASNEVYSIIEEKTNTTINWVWVPDAARNERMTTAIASQELGTIVTFTDLQNTTIRGAMNAGMFWELTPFLDSFPNLSQISQERRNAASIEGRLYGVPLERFATRRGFTIRYDWLQNLGLDIPTTMDELFEVAYQFTHNDPAGDGSDTFGFLGRNEFISMSFSNTLAFMGGPNRWRVEGDGSFTHAFETEEWVENMQWWKRAVEYGLINPDFLVTSPADQRQLFAQGRGGLFPNLTNMDQLRALSEGIAPDEFALYGMNQIHNGDGVYRVIGEGANGVGGVWSIPKSEVQTEGELMRVLHFIDQLYSAEIQMLIGSGVEGIHYEINEDGTISRINQDLWEQQVQPMNQNIASPVRNSSPAAHPEIVQRDEAILQNENFVVFNPAFGLNSEIFNTRGADLDMMMHDATIQFIMGAITLEAWQGMLSNWQNTGGRDMAVEFAESYARMQAQ